MDTFEGGRSIALAVVALMTLTAGVAAAKANKAKFETTGNVLAVGPSIDHSKPYSVDSEFKIHKKSGDYKSVKIHTVNEAVFGFLSTEDPKCKESDKKSGTACASVISHLAGASILSTHESRATLKVTAQPADFAPDDFPWFEFEVLEGTLKGKLEAELGVVGSAGPLAGDAKLKIRSTAPSKYACYTGVIEGLAPFGFAPIYVRAVGSGLMVPVDLHVIDSGNFKVKGVDAAIKGKMTVTVDSTISLSASFEPIYVTSGDITIDKSHAEFGN
jgi:hypothetical protein